MAHSEKDKITRAAGIVGSATLLSRIFGLVRDLVTAYFFGAGLAADAFFVAFRLPNLLRRLLAEGALTVSFIPIFTEYLSTRTRQEAFALARAALTLFSIILSAVSIAGVLAAPLIIKVFAPGFSVDPEKFALTVLLTRIMFPYIFLIGLVALAMGVLNSLGKFAGPALSPVMLNIGMITSVLWLSRYFDPPVLALAVGVIIGGIMQVLLQVPYLKREGGLLGLSFRFKHPALRRIGKLMAPAALGAAVYQFSVFINTLLASYLPEGSVSYLYYADRIMQFPLGVFAIAVGTAVLPSMSRQAAKKNYDELADTLSYSLRLIFFISLPAMVGMIVLAGPLIRMLFQHGRFDLHDAMFTAQALVAYASGLWALSAVQVVVRVFYSLQDTRTPAKVAAISLIGNVILGVTLMGPFQHVGLALASAGGSTLNLVLLILFLKKRLSGVDGGSVVRAAFRQTVWAAIMGLVVLLVVGHPSGDIGKMELAVRALGGTVLGTGVYLGLALAWKSPECLALVKMLRRR